MTPPIDPVEERCPKCYRLRKDGRGHLGSSGYLKVFPCDHPWHDQAVEETSIEKDAEMVRYFLREADASYSGFAALDRILEEVKQSAYYRECRDQWRAQAESLVGQLTLEKQRGEGLGVALFEVGTVIDTMFNESGWPPVRLAARLTRLQAITEKALNDPEALRISQGDGAP